MQPHWSCKEFVWRSWSYPKLSALLSKKTDFCTHTHTLCIYKIIYIKVLKDSGSHWSLSQHQYMCHHAVTGLWATSDSEQCNWHVHHWHFLHHLHFPFPCLTQTLAQPSSVSHSLQFLTRYCITLQRCLREKFHSPNCVSLKLLPLGIKLVFKTLNHIKNFQCCKRKRARIMAI